MVVSSTVLKQISRQILGLVGHIFFFISMTYYCALIWQRYPSPILVRSFLPRTLKDPNPLNDVIEPFFPYLSFPCVRIPRYFDNNLVDAVARYCVLNILALFVFAGLRAIKCAANLDIKRCLSVVLITLKLLHCAILVVGVEHILVTDISRKSLRWFELLRCS